MQWTFAGDGVIRHAQSHLQAARQPELRRPQPGPGAQAQRRLRHIPLARGLQGHAGGRVHSRAPTKRG